MVTMTRTLAIDGWWPQIRWPHVLCGASTATLVDMRDGTVVSVIGTPGAAVWPAGWLTDGRYVVTREVAKDIRQSAIMRVGDTVPVWGQSFDVGGPVKVFADRLVYGGHPSYTPQHAGLWWGRPDGTNWTPMPTTPIGGVHGMSIRIANGRMAAHVVDPDVWWVLEQDGSLAATLPTDHLCIPGADTTHGMGYWGAAMLHADARYAAGPWDLTVVPWRQESCPLPFMDGPNAWIATATGQDGFDALVLRQLTDHLHVLQINGVASVAMDIIVLDHIAHIAANDAKGKLSLVDADLHGPRALFAPPLAATPATYVESPTSAVVHDVWRFVVGEADAWPRTGQRGEAMHCHRTDDGQGSESAWFVKSNSPIGWERWALRDGAIWHCEDHSGNDQQLHGESYQFSDGRWLNNTMQVGEVIDRRDSNRLRWYRDGAWTPWEKFPYKVTLASHRTYSDGHEEITVVYDPGGDQDSYEVYSMRSDRGWDTWSLYDQHDDELLHCGTWPNRGGHVVVPVDARVPWPAVRPVLIITPPPVLPPITPEIPMKPRAQWMTEFGYVNEFYASKDGLQRPGGMVIDRDGIPTCDVEAMQQWGYDLLTDSVESIKAKIRLSDEWKTKHVGETPDPQ